MGLTCVGCGSSSAYRWADLVTYKALTCTPLAVNSALLAFLATLRASTSLGLTIACSTSDMPQHSRKMP